MILRRLSQSLKEQNWAAIWIEFILLILGVFLGIQVANWNEDRIDRKREQDFLERLLIDIENDQTALERRLNYIRESITYGEDALTWVEDGTLVESSEWKTVMAFYNASRILPYTPLDTTYQEMRSSGQLGLLRDPKLRSALGMYFVISGAVRSDFIVKLNPEYRSHVRGLTPFRIARYISSKCFNILTTKHLACNSPIDDASADVILQRYKTAPELTDELAYWIDSAHLMIEILGKQRDDNVKLQQRIHVKLGRTPNKDTP